MFRCLHFDLFATGISTKLLIYVSRIRRNLFIHIARIPIGDSPRVHPNILKCSLHSPVVRVIRLVVFATRAMVCDTRTHCLILNSLASVRGRVILRSHFLILLLLIILISLYILTYFKNTKNLFIHIALIPEGDNPRVNPNILKCLLHSPVAKGYRLVVIASRAMVCKTPTHYLILNSLAFARGCVILRSHILFPLLLILLISHHI